MEVASKNMTNFEVRTKNVSFDNILKSQIEENKKLREEIGKKTEEIFKLRDNYSSSRSQFENLKSEIQINKLKNMSDLKNAEVTFQIESQNIKNQLDAATRQGNLLEQKLQLVIEESRKKDSFIQNYIINKKLLQNDKDIVEKFIKQYQITIGSCDIVERLSAETKEIEQITNYNRILLKEIAHLKEKILEYEAIDEERVSVYDSKISKYSINSNDIMEEEKDKIDKDFIVTRTPKASESKLKKIGSLQV